MNSGIRSGMVGGTCLCMIPQISSGDIVKTVILAVIGALVSFVCASVLKKWQRPQK